MQVTDAVALAKRGYHAPVCVRYCKPLAIAWSDIDVDRTKIIVLLVAGSSTTWYLKTIIQKLITFEESKERTYQFSIFRLFEITLRCCSSDEIVLDYLIIKIKKNLLRSKEKAVKECAYKTCLVTPIQGNF